jgi:pimeloyl-ACP methyl ester carboxylesterase
VDSLHEALLKWVPGIPATNVPERLWSKVDGCLVHAHASGDGPAVVLIHGLGVSSAYFLPLAERLAARFRVYALDLPGHGRSATPRRALDVPQLAGALSAWMQARGLERAALVGQSMGCQVAVEAALRASERVERLVLIGPTPDPAAGTAELLRRLVVDAAFERPGMIWQAFKDYLRMNMRVLPEFQAMLRDPFMDKLARVRVPALVARGERDPIAPQPFAEEVARRLRCEVVVVPGWGHAVQHSAPGAVFDALQAFLARR